MVEISKFSSVGRFFYSHLNGKRVQYCFFQLSCFDVFFTKPREYAFKKKSNCLLAFFFLLFNKKH